MEVDFPTIISNHIKKSFRNNYFNSKWYLQHVFLLSSEIVDCYLSFHEMSMYVTCNKIVNGVYSNASEVLLNYDDPELVDKIIGEITSHLDQHRDIHAKYSIVQSQNESNS